MDKPKNTTGIVDGKLHCFVCKSTYDMALPKPVLIAAMMMKDFDKHHKQCKYNTDDKVG